MRLNGVVFGERESPISETYAIDRHRSHADRRPFLDLAQAAPQYPPAPAVREHIASVARSERGAEYVDIPGLPQLREVFAADLEAAYRGDIHEQNVVITAGCNQAFCVVISALASPGDEVIIAIPYYFNHDMWLRLNQIRPVYLDPGADLVPSAHRAEELVTETTRAIVLVTPGNPSGVTIEPGRLEQFAEVARRHDIALVLDETYRSFRDSADPAHHLFVDPEWTRTVVSLHSFSKDLALPGYRVGAVVASPILGRQIMKVLDCVAICAPRTGQEAAWAGLVHAGDWRLARARELSERRRWFASAMAGRPGGFRLVSIGGFFAWIRHPFPSRATEDVVRNLAIDQGLLLMPGTAFMPDDRQMLRASVSNVGCDQISDLACRLQAAGEREPSRC